MIIVTVSRRRGAEQYSQAAARKSGNAARPPGAADFAVWKALAYQARCIAAQ
jgi:hypothetical protein